MGLLISIAGMAQTPPNYLISGKISDSVAHSPIDYATVLLKNDKKTALKSVVTSKDGSFGIHGIPTGKYFLTIVYVGYQTKMISVTVANADVNVGEISLKANATKLKEVTVVGDRPLIKQEIDRISYDVKADPEAKVNNVLEMMRKVPLLSVDGDDNIQLQGNSNYKILINGKPSGMVERNPKDILKSMPAASIERIEVITTPPAKYDGEGLAGIINIITYKKADNGTNGTININERFPVGGPGIGGTFTLKNGKFGLATNVGGNLNSSPLLNNTNARSTFGSTPTNLFQSGSRNFSGKSGYGGIELSYELDSLNLISAQFNYNANSNDVFNSQNSILNGSSGVLQRYELSNDVNNAGDGIDASFNYQLGFKKNKNRLLTFSYRYYDFSNTQFNDVNIFNTVAYTVPNYHQDSKSGSSEQTVQVDYTLPIKKITMEAGIKAIFRDNTSNFEYLSVNSSGFYTIDPTRTNNFDNQQNVFGVYNSYQFALKKWGVKAGLRIEQTHIDANFYGAGSQFSSNSLNFIPAISVNRKFKNMTNLNLGITSRIQRPGIYQLNPFVDRSNPNFETTGNPDLKPMYGYALEASYSIMKKAAINIGFRAMTINNLIMPRVTTDPTTNVTTSSFGNTGSATLFGLNLNVNYPFTQKLRAQLGAMGNYGMVKGEVGGVMIDKKGLMRKAFTSFTYRPTKTWQGTASVNYNGPGLSLQGTTNSFVFYSFSVNKDLFDNKFTLSAAANNAFSKYRKAINYTNGTNFTQESFNQNYQRNFTISANYRFGKLKDAIKKNKKGINNNDVSEGTSL